MKVLFSIIAITVAVVTFGAQREANQLTFEVASIKPADPSQFSNGVRESLGLPVRGRCRGVDSKFAADDPGGSIPLGRCRAVIARLDNIVALAYGTVAQMIDVSNAPAWTRTELFAIEAEAADPATTSEAQLLTMLQNLLADRFKLKLHRETRQADGYALMVGKNGPKLALAKSDEDAKVVRGTISRTHIELTCQKISMSRLALLLTVGTPLGLGTIVDRTNLPGDFDFKLMSDEDAGPSIFTAIQNQLGLRLEQQKVPTDIIVIDAAEKPPLN